MCNIYTSLGRFGWILGASQMRKDSDMPMRGHQHHWKVVVIASAMVLGTPGRTQTPLCTVDTLAPSTWSPGGSRANAPYNATVKTTFDQNCRAAIASTGCQFPTRRVTRRAGH